MNHSFLVTIIGRCEIESEFMRVVGFVFICCEVGNKGHDPRVERVGRERMLTLIVKGPTLVCF